MKIVKATKKDAEEVFGVIKETVLTVYPGYYPPAVASWFANELHGFARTAEEIAAGQVYALKGARIFGTVCVKEDTVHGLFVLPGYERRGFGALLLRFAEKVIAANYPVARLDSSLPTEQFYLRQGYAPEGEGEAVVYGERLVWKKMAKRLRED